MIARPGLPIMSPIKAIRIYNIFLLAFRK